MQLHRHGAGTSWGGGGISDLAAVSGWEDDRVVWPVHACTKGAHTADAAVKTFIRATVAVGPL
eukprot:6200296-Pleurochrysis_carterae.AAC.2